MIHQAMSVYDCKARAYLPPFYVPHVDVGIRYCQSAANDPSHAFAKNPEDFRVYHLGSFDDDTGRYQAFIENIVVCEMASLVKGGVA